jgi:phage gp36-like protein
MSLYATVNDVRTALAPDGDFDSPATAASLEDAQLTDALVEASAEVDGMVKGAPFADVPVVIQGIVRDVAAYLATLTHRQGNPVPNEHPVALRYKRAEALLAAAASGKLDLTQEVEEEARPGGVAVVNPYEGSLFTFEDLGLGPMPPDAFPPWVR